MSYATAVNLRKALLQFSANNDFLGNLYVLHSLNGELKPSEVVLGDDEIEFRGFVYRRGLNEVSASVLDDYESVDLRFVVRGSKTIKINSVNVDHGWTKQRPMPPTKR